MKGTALRRKKPLKKKSSAASIKRRLDDLCRAVVFARDRNKCRLADAGMGPCGGHLQACHILAKGHYPSLRFEPDNVIAGCWRHHAPQSPASWHSNPMDYAQWFMSEYRRRWMRLELLRMEARKLDYEEEERKLRSLL